MDERVFQPVCRLIRDEARRLLEAGPPPVAGTELWRIMKLAHNACGFDALDRICDEAPDPSDLELTAEQRRAFVRILLMARYKADVRGERERPG